MKDINSASKPKERSVQAKPRKQATFNNKFEKSPAKQGQIAEAEAPAKIKKSEKKLKVKIANNAPNAVDDAPSQAENPPLVNQGAEGNETEEPQTATAAQVTSWMQFFSQKEIDNAITESKKPVRKLTKEELKKQEANEKAEESDSEPSCDNYDEHELADRFDAAISEDERPELSKPEPPK